MEVAVSLSYEFSLASPFLNLMISQYKDQPMLSQVVSKLYHILEAAQTKRNYKFGQCLYEFKQTSIAIRIIDDFDNFLDGKFDEMTSI
jgi:hypothetical protein